jgi:hypothetical protein
MTPLPLVTFAPRSPTSRVRAEIGQLPYPAGEVASWSTVGETTANHGVGWEAPAAALLAWASARNMPTVITVLFTIGLANVIPRLCWVTA